MRTFNSLPKGCKDVEEVLYHQGLPYVPEIIYTKLISNYHNDILASHFKIDKTRKFIARKYYWSTLCCNIKAYIKSCDSCLSSKSLHHKPYSNHSSLLIPIYYCKDLSIDFIIDLLILTDWKSYSYDSILVTIDCLTKMVYCKPVKIIINIVRLIEVIIDVLLKDYVLLELIISN